MRSPDNLIPHYKLLLVSRENILEVVDSILFQEYLMRDAKHSLIWTIKRNTLVLVHEVSKEAETNKNDQKMNTFLFKFNDEPGRKTY